MAEIRLEVTAVYSEEGKFNCYAFRTILNKEVVSKGRALNIEEILNGHLTEKIKKILADDWVVPKFSKTIRMVEGRTSDSNSRAYTRKPIGHIGERLKKGLEFYGYNLEQ